MDDEVGSYVHRSRISQGTYCRPLADYPGEIEIHLRPSIFSQATNTTDENEIAHEIAAEIATVPTALRLEQISQLMTMDLRPHAVCTVQTFCNPQSGQSLFSHLRGKFHIPVFAQARCCTCLSHTTKSWAGGEFTVSCVFGTLINNYH